MSETVVKIENLGKRYNLGEVGVGTLRGDLSRQWSKLRGLEDPTGKVGDVAVKQVNGFDELWVLRGLNLEVSRGEAIGLLGANGAGKSTLLKLLSRITAPTEGRIRARGRVASLLEVGTGFHNELTGRENIFMNGAVMGMRRHEILTQIDNIIEFSGCGAHIDTPVKRYSSGMFVRLGFSVAAHLQSEILIVDEVLAVGDRKFQMRCIDKMRSMTLNGDKTIIFVSHDLSAVRSLCKSGAVISDGKAIKYDTITNAINAYTRETGSGSAMVRYDKMNNQPFISSICVDLDKATRGNIAIKVSFESEVPFRPHPGIVILSSDMRPMLGTNGSMHEIRGTGNEVSRGTFECEFENVPLHQGEYHISVWLGNESKDFDHKYAALSFEFQPVNLILSKPAIEEIGSMNIEPKWLFKNT